MKIAVFSFAVRGVARDRCAVSAQPCTVLSGGPIEHLREGWARIPFRGNKAHWWAEEPLDPPLIAGGGRVRTYRSACGMEAVVTRQLPALGVGTMAWCGRCARQHRAPDARERLTFLDTGMNRRLTPLDRP